MSDEPSGLMQGAPPPADQQVTLANWRLPPFNRWAFSRVREFVPTAAIAGGGAAPDYEGRDLGGLDISALKAAAPASATGLARRLPTGWRS